ncbi:flagellar motor switch protein FliN/FliY [Hasllibacter halocynthiae]|uniref:Flagellar motor switch protein FliN/FliY n=1 Tax=Hasllibacter halocynthiae TaxID=595589 RepID=A0A2T0X2M6_9RHOB|nr:FliM/FliN family flagellar motor switch protein [Hasllibacter halocynthiae]PRY93196.1 flagellar motor switch protein FliN/FliY [Hasllibacter halocynthiae]
MADRAAFSDMPIEVTIALGNARPTLGELMALTDGSVLPLDRGVEDPVDLFVGERLIGRGILEEGPDGEGLQVRLVEVSDD